MFVGCFAFYSWRIHASIASIPCVLQEKTEEFSDFVQSLPYLDKSGWLVVTSPEAADLLIEAWKYVMFWYSSE